MANSPVLTFLFTDIEDSSALWDRQTNDMRESHAVHNEVITAAIQAAGGEIVKDRGDGYMAVFTSPQRALEAAAAAQRGLANTDWSRLGRELKVRMGVHTGVAESRDGDYYGPDVNIAARLEGLAHGGQVLMSEATQALTARVLPDGFDAVPLGEVRLKGIGAPERVYQLVAPGLEGQFPALPGSQSGHPLPNFGGSLFGREKDLTELDENFRNGARLVTLLGPGGIGKTRLAIEAARRLSATTGSPAYFADMAPVRVDAEVGPTVAESLGVHVEGSADPFELIASRILEPTVAVFDNLEHLEGFGTPVAGLLANCPELSIIATSRSPLRIRDERIYSVQPLSNGSNGASAAVELFMDRAANRGVSLSEADRDTIAALCAKVDGLPLAIELLAAQTRLVGLEDLDRMLSDSIDTVESDDADRPTRHRSIRDTIEWSVGSLDETHRLLFAQLAAFPGGATIEQLSFIRGDTPARVLRAVATLVDNSLAMPATGLPGGTRFRQLTLLREYGLEILAATDQFDAVMGRLVDHYLTIAPALHASLLSDNRATRLLEADHANLVAAMEWSIDGGRAEDMASFLADIWLYWFNGDRTATVADFTRRSRPLTSSAKARYLDGFIHGFQIGDMESAAELLTEAEASFAEAGDDYWLAMTRLWIGAATPDPSAAHAILEDAFEELAKYDQFPAIRPLALLFLSIADAAAGDTVTALERRREANEWARRVGHPELIAWMPWNIGSALAALGRSEEALGELPNGFEYMVNDGYQEGTASFGHLIGVLAVQMGETELGVELIGASDAVMDKIGIAAWGEIAALRDQALQQAAEAAGEAAAANTLEAGRSLTIEELVDRARAVFNRLS